MTFNALSQRIQDQLNVIHGSFEDVVLGLGKNIPYWDFEYCYLLIQQQQKRLEFNEGTISKQS